MNRVFMCGRFLITDDMLEAVGRIARIPRAVQLELNLGTIYPSRPSLVLVESNHILTGTVMDFGFESKNLKKRLINARAETLETKPMFRSALAHRRCLIPCACFYEWDAAKQQYSFYLSGQPVLYLAGLFIEGQFIIITTKANASIEPYHHRMPLCLSEPEAIEWIMNPACSASLLKTVPVSLDHTAVTPQPRLFS